MYDTTPNLDKLASEGMRFTDYYAEPSCTAGRANFITGEVPIRTGLTTVGQAGSKIGKPDEAPTIATALKALGYEAAQFGKNHPGDLNQYLPTLHGFDEFWGLPLSPRRDGRPFLAFLPSSLEGQSGSTYSIHSFATDVDDPTVEPRWGKVGKQVITDEEGLCRLIRRSPYQRYNMETVDDDVLDHTVKFIDKAEKDEKALLCLDEPHPRVHVISHLSPKYQGELDAGKPVVS